MDKFSLDMLVQNGHDFHMTLKEWLETTQTKVTDFARLIGVGTRTVYRYRNGERIPEADVMKRIKSVTDQKVTADSFYQ